VKVLDQCLGSESLQLLNFYSASKNNCIS